MNTIKHNHNEFKTGIISFKTDSKNYINIMQWQKSFTYEVDRHSLTGDIDGIYINIDILEDQCIGRQTHNTKQLLDVLHEMILTIFNFSCAGVHLIQQFATCGLKDNPTPAFLRAMRVTASSTSMGRYAQSSPSLPAFAKTEHIAPYWKTTPKISSGSKLWPTVTA